MKITKKARRNRERCFHEFAEPEVNDGDYIAIHAGHRLYVRQYVGNGRRFAWIFLDVWHRLPKKIQRKILELWYSCGEIECARCFSPYIVLDDGSFLGDWVKDQEEVNLAIVEEDGHHLRFNAQRMDQLPENVVADVVAYVLAMVLQFAIGTRPDRQGTVNSIADMLQETDDLMSAWGFDPDSVDDWYEEMREGRQPDARGNV
jgi:hypothetical protein